MRCTTRVDDGSGEHYISVDADGYSLLLDPLTNLLIMGVAFLVFMVAGTIMFVRAERNR